MSELYLATTKMYLYRSENEGGLEIFVAMNDLNPASFKHTIYPDMKLQAEPMGDTSMTALSVPTMF